MDQLQQDIDQKTSELKTFKEEQIKLKSDYRMLSDSFYRIKSEKEEQREYINGLEQKLKQNDEK